MIVRYICIQFLENISDTHDALDKWHHFITSLHPYKISLLILYRFDSEKSNKHTKVRKRSNKNEAK